MSQHTEPWYKIPATLPFNTRLMSLEPECFRVFVCLQCCLAHKRSQTVTEKEFVAYTPVRSWRGYVKKLAAAGLVVWDRDAGVVSIPQFSELNPQFDGGRLSYTPTRDADTAVGRVRKGSQLAADLEYDYDPTYVSPLWDEPATTTAAGDAAW